MRAFLLAVLLAGIAAANPLPPSARFVKRAVVPPSQDPFYQPPAGYESTEPGTVLKSRSVQTAFLTIIPTVGITSYQVLYRTTGAVGQPSATVATIFKPANAQKNILVGYATAYDSAFVDCAPSYGYQQGGSTNNGIVQFESFILATAVAQGWTVVSSDYEQFNASFGAGRLSGQGVLDGLRATLNYAPVGLAKSSKVAQFGYSGGAIASGWAASLQPTYASELNMVGWAFGGTPANVSETLQFLDGTLFSGFGFAGTTGLITAYPELQSYYETKATQAGKDAVQYAKTHCANDDISQFAFKRLQSSTYTTLGDQLLYDPVVQSVTSQNTMGTAKNITPTAPVFMYHSNTDEIIPVAGATALYNRWCAYGIKSLVYQIDIGPSEHASLEIFGVPAVISFLRDRIAGKPAQSGCSISNVALPTPPVTALGLGPSVITLTALNTILSQQIGIDDSILKSKFKPA